MAEQHRFGNVIAPITCHAWNVDRSQIALSPNNNEVHVYERHGPQWTQTDALNQHDLRVMGIDWAPTTNRIVTCAVDRNAYVWNQGTDGKWTPTLVLLRINRAATCVKWSPKENKFAVGSGARLISVCYFEQENDWWVSKHIKRPIRSTVTALDWHPNNVLLAAGSADYKVRVFSAWIKDVEKAADVTAWGVAGAKQTLGAMLVEWPNSTAGGGGWVHSVSFSPDGGKVAWVAHDSSVNVAIAGNTATPAYKLRTEFLPFLSVVWIDSLNLIAGGHGCIPITFTVSPTDGTITQSQRQLEQTGSKRGEGGSGGVSAMRKFQFLDKQARSEGADTSLESLHQNAITCVCKYNGGQADGGDVKHISTSGLDGQLVIWDLAALRIK